MTSPPKKMVNDVRRYTPFKEHFITEELDKSASKTVVDTLEAHHIQRLQSIKHGYNNLRGRPYSSKNTTT